MGLKNRTCDISIHGYIANVLRKFQHDKPKHPQDTPSRYVMPVYGAKTQCTTQDETPRTDGLWMKGESMTY
jgi:hypothetical protein